MKRRERLDFTGDDARADDPRSAHINRLLSSISQNRPGSLKPQSPSGIQSISSPFSPLSGPIPPSSALERAQAFLPLLAQSNAELLSRAAADPSSVAIEILGSQVSDLNGSNGSIESENDQQIGASASASSRYIAMDLGLGVFDVPGMKEGSNFGLGKGRDLGLGPEVLIDAELLEKLSRQAAEEDEENWDDDKDEVEDGKKDDEILMRVRCERRTAKGDEEVEVEDESSDDEEDSDDGSESDKGNEDQEDEEIAIDGDKDVAKACM